MTISVDFDGNKRRSDGLALITLSGPQIKPLEVDLPFRGLFRSLGSPSPEALDLLVVAGACYVVDKATARKSASDVWTRDLSVSFPVSDPERWGKIAPRLDTALSFLSGDVWRTSFRKSPCDLFVAPKTRRKKTLTPDEPDAFDAVTLFSGGLDSLIGSIDYLRESPESRIMLIGHYDAPGPKSQQEELYQRMKARFPGRTKLVQVRVSQRPSKNTESTLRSRSIVFIGLGIYAASEMGFDVPLFAPENGMIALNLPLTPSRSGSCSTRTMHPFYLDTLRTVLKDLGLGNNLVNPSALKTKGECVTQCRDLELLSSLVALTVSCSHGTRRQDWVRKKATNCGYCVPCLFRRASLHVANLDSGKDYGVDVCADELTVDSEKMSADDLRAVTSGLRHFDTDASIRKAITSVALVQPVNDYVHLVRRGLSEVRRWIAERGSAKLREAAGISDGEDA
jgi:7-cyano-7-deazaguanine synthase in queuosine biosynthesis